MINEKNLVPLSKRTKEEQRVIQSKGGKASAEARRKKKKLRECAEILLNLPVSDKRKLSQLITMGLPEVDIDNRMLMVAALLKKAQSGDVGAIKEIRSLIGEDTITLTGTAESDNLFEAIRAAVLEREKDV